MDAARKQRRVFGCLRARRTDSCSDGLPVSCAAGWQRMGSCCCVRWNGGQSAGLSRSPGCCRAGSRSVACCGRGLLTCADANNSEMQDYPSRGSSDGSTSETLTGYSGQGRLIERMTEVDRHREERDGTSLKTTYFLHASSASRRRR